MTTTTTPNYLDSLLGGGGALRVEGNGITGQQVAAVVHLGEGTTGDYDVASQTVEVSATPVTDQELGLYYYGVGAAGLNSVSTFTSGGPIRELGYDAVVSPSAQKFYTAFPTSWGHAFVVLAGSMVGTLAPRAIAVDGQAYTLLESAETASGSNLGYYVTKYATVPGSGGAAAINHILIVDGTNGASTGDGSLGAPFQTITQAMNWAASHSIYRPIVALAPGTYTGEIAVPEDLRGIVLSEFVNGALDSSSTSTVRIVGDISCTSYQGISRVDLNRIFLTGDIVSRNPIAEPAQLNLCARDCQITGNLTASQIVVKAHRTKFVVSTIAASSGYVALDLDRFTRKGILDSGASITITPSPTITILDGPLTVAQGGDPGGGGDVTVNSDRRKLVYNFEDGRRVWEYERLFSLKLVNGVDNTTIQITESEHGGEGTPVHETGVDVSYPVALVRLELFGHIPDGSEGIAGIFREVYEGAIDKNAYSSGWDMRENLSMVTAWGTTADAILGGITSPTMTLSGGPTWTLIIHVQFNGIESPPSNIFAKVTINGTGKFQV